MASTEILIGKRILIVEDNDINRELAKEVLEDISVKVECSKNGKDAVKKISKNPAGYYDFVLMDIHMPRMDGYEATTLIRALEDKNKAMVPIIATTIDTSEEDKRRELECGINGHVSKPISIPELLETIAQFMESYDQISGLMADLT